MAVNILTETWSCHLLTAKPIFDTRDNSVNANIHIVNLGLLKWSHIILKTEQFAKLGPLLVNKAFSLALNTVLVSTIF